MRNLIQTVCILLLLFFVNILSAQETAIESAAIKEALQQNASNGSVILNTETGKEVSKQTKMLLEAEKAKELNEKNINAETDDDDEKVINVRSDDFLREITLSTKGHYGYDLFYTSKGFKMESTMTSYSDYMIGPGDEIIISMWGDVELRKTLKVSKEGTIYVDNVGMITVSGYKLDELELKLKKQLSKAYITLDPPSGEASTYLDVSMGKLKPITVFLVGEVFKQGALKLDSYSTVFTALYNSGGPTAKGTLRNIQVVRNGKVVSAIDIYDYLLTGKKVNDIILKNNDNILVPPRYSSVKLKGEVNNEKIYEMKDDETLADLIKYSGGVKITSLLDRMLIERILPFEKRTDVMYTKETLAFEFGKIVKGKVRINPVALEDGDIITVFPISDILINEIKVGGSVLLPGKYAKQENMTLADLLSKAGGLLPEAYLKRAHLRRLYPDLTSEIFEFDLTKDDYKTFKLESSDSLRIYSKWELKKTEFVSLSGNIAQPGKYPLDKNLKISDLILLGGGLEDPVFKKTTYLERADLIRYNEDGITTKIIPIDLKKVLDGDQSEDIILKNRDHLKIYNVNILIYPQTVEIKGLVRSPGVYDMQTNMKVEDLILQAGGFQRSAYLYEAEVFRVDPYNISSEQLVSVHKIKINKDYLKADLQKINNPFLLQDKDLVVIRKHPDYQLQRNVTINGEVKFPGVYSLQKENETLAELIERAGGLKNEAFVDGISFVRDSINVLSDFNRIKKGSCSGDLVLKHGDVVHIPKHPGVVKVDGFVFSPGLVKYNDCWDLEDYVEAAGGIMVDDNYEAGETVVYYPGGAAEVDGWFFSPEVKEGSRIVVKRLKKPEEKDGMSVKEWVSVLASIVTISYYLSNVN